MRCDWLRSKPNLTKRYRKRVKFEQFFWFRPFVMRQSGEIKFSNKHCTERQHKNNSFSTNLQHAFSYYEEWSGFFPVQIHHINVVIKDHGQYLRQNQVVFTLFSTADALLYGDFNKLLCPLGGGGGLAKPMLNSLLNPRDQRTAFLTNQTKLTDE